MHSVFGARDNKQPVRRGPRHRPSSRRDSRHVSAVSSDAVLRGLRVGSPGGRFRACAILVLGISSRVHGDAATSLPGHGDAEALLGADEVVDVVGGLVDVDLHPVGCGR